MFFEKKLARSFETSQYISDKCCKRRDGNEEPVKLEWKDGLAMALSAILVFGPIFLLVGGLAFLLTL